MTKNFLRMIYNLKTKLPIMIVFLSPILFTGCSPSLAIDISENLVTSGVVYQTVSFSFIRAKLPMVAPSLSCNGGFIDMHMCPHLEFGVIKFPSPLQIIEAHCFPEDKCTVKMGSKQLVVAIPESEKAELHIRLRYPDEPEGETFRATISIPYSQFEDQPKVFIKRENTPGRRP